MEKMKMESVDIIAQNVEKIGELFPNCITETIDENGKPKKAINFDMLKQMLSDDVLEGDEANEFTWVGKKAAIVESNKPIRKTLRPCKEESVDWDNTGNLYIEGDNLEVMKLLQESYLNSIKLIYIDPPYNTGKDFVYRDDFRQGVDDFDISSGVYNEDGDKLILNTESNGRFHSDWCSMIYSRLLLARNLLADNGVIFISIDDNEIDNLKKICNEVFGETNFVAQFPWQSRQSMQNDTDISINNEYVIAYAKKRRFANRRLKESNANTWFDEPSFCCLPLPLSEEAFSNPDNDPRGPWKADPFDAPNVRPNLTYVIKNPVTGEEFLPPKGRHWRTEEKSYKKLLEDDRIVFGKNGTSRPQLKVFYEEKKIFGSVNTNWWTGEKCGTTTQGTKEQMKLFDGVAPFDTPKPTKMIKQILQLVSLPKSDDIILDFFAGSSTTAHAVMDQNIHDGGKRKFIMVQLDENCVEGSVAKSLGYEKITEIGKERIRRAIKKIEEENPEADFDGGFRVFKLDESNMNDVYYNSSEYSQDLLSSLESNIKPDRTDLDLLFGCLLEWGLPLSLPYSSEEIDGCTVHDYNDGDLIACFDENVPDSVVKAIAKKKPLRAVFRDSSFSDSPSKINVGEIFKLLAPDTRVKVI